MRARSDAFLVPVVEATPIDAWNRGVYQQSTVLVVDDERSSRARTAKTLRGLSVDGQFVEVLSCSDDVAMDKIQEHRQTLDLLITDLQMPEISGLDLLARFRALPDHVHTPVMMLTIESSAQCRLEALKAGVVAYLLKPLNIDEVLSVCHSLVSMNRRRRLAEAALARLLSQLGIDGLSSNLVGELSAGSPMVLMPTSAVEELVAQVDVINELNRALKDSARAWLGRGHLPDTDGQGQNSGWMDSVDSGSVPLDRL